MIVCDNYVDMNTADANGTVINGASLSIMDNGTQGTPQGTWSYTGTGVFTIEASGGSGSDKPDTVGLRAVGTQYAKSSTHRPFRLANNVAVTDLRITTAGVAKYYAVSGFGWITEGAADPGPGAGHPFDQVRFDNLSGNYAVVQLWNNDAPNGGGYAVNLHSNPGGVTTTTGRIVLTPGAKYYMWLFFDSKNSTATLWIWDSSLNLMSGAPITAATNSGADQISTMRFGNGEVGTSTGNTDFENWGIDWTNAQKPRDNQSPIGPESEFLEKWASTFNDASGSSLSVNVTNVKQGDLIWAFAKYEGGATGVTFSDTADIPMQSRLGTVSNALGDPICCSASCFSSQLSGTVTYTVTWGAARTFREFVVVAIEAVSPWKWRYERAVTPSVFATGNSTAVASPQQNYTLPRGAIGFNFVGYGGFGGAITFAAVGGDNKTDLNIPIGGGAASGMWMKEFFGPLLGNATATIASNRWNVLVDSFIAVRDTPPLAPAPRAPRMFRC